MGIETDQDYIELRAEKEKIHKKYKALRKGVYEFSRNFRRTLNAEPFHGMGYMHFVGSISELKKLMHNINVDD